MTQSVALLSTGFLRSAERFPNREALTVANQTVSYKKLAERARCCYASSWRDRWEVPLTAVFAYRSMTAYAAVLGALVTRRGYGPLHRTFPIDRTRLMLLQVPRDLLSGF